jgi:hypothetical protein
MEWYGNFRLTVLVQDRSSFDTTPTPTIAFQKNIFEIHQIQWVIFLQLECQISLSPPYIKLTLDISMG